MKFRNIVICLIVATAAYVVLKRSKGISEISLPKLLGTSNQSPVPQTISRAARERGWTIQEAAGHYEAVMAKAPQFRLHGTVVQHLPDGYLLVTGYLLGKGEYTAPTKVYALFGHPEADKLADQKPMECQVCNLGTYLYVTAEGAKRSADELIYSRGTDPTGPPKPGEWMNDRTKPRTLLDR